MGKKRRLTTKWKHVAMKNSGGPAFQKVSVSFKDKPPITTTIWDNERIELPRGYTVKNIEAIEFI